MRASSKQWLSAAVRPAKFAPRTSPGPQAHAGKLAFEQYFMWKTRHGYANLP